jgi:hypothetical protein
MTNDVCRLKSSVRVKLMLTVCPAREEVSRDFRT